VGTRRKGDHERSGYNPGKIARKKESSEKSGNWGIISEEWWFLWTGVPYKMQEFPYRQKERPERPDSGDEVVEK